MKNVFSNNLFMGFLSSQRVDKAIDITHLFLIKRRRSRQSMPITKRSESSIQESDCQCYRLRREYCFPVFLSEIWNNEDPVTGSAHTLIVPYYSLVLGRTKINARQLSERGGELSCEVLEDRIRIGGHTAVFFSGEIEV